MFRLQTSVNFWVGMRQWSLSAERMEGMAVCGPAASYCSAHRLTFLFTHLNTREAPHQVWLFVFLLGLHFLVILRLLECNKKLFYNFFYTSYQIINTEIIIWLEKTLDFFYNCQIRIAGRCVFLLVSLFFFGFFSPLCFQLLPNRMSVFHPSTPLLADPSASCRQTNEHPKVGLLPPLSSPVIKKKAIHLSSFDEKGLVFQMSDFNPPAADE